LGIVVPRRPLPQLAPYYATYLISQLLTDTVQLTGLLKCKYPLSRLYKLLLAELSL